MYWVFTVSSTEHGYFKDKMDLTVSLLNILSCFSLNVREWHMRTCTHTGFVLFQIHLLVGLSLRPLKMRYTLKCDITQASPTSLNYPHESLVFQFLGALHSNIFWGPWITTTIMATIHSLCIYYVPRSATSNSIGNWLSILITQRRA